MPDSQVPRYVKPGWFTKHVFNGLVALLTRAGISVWGSRQLRVRGRTSGEWRTTPVNLLVHEGGRYLVAPRGETQWVRNLRAAGTGELRVGRRIEPFRATELGNAEKPPVLRSYLRRWKAEVGVFFSGVSAKSPDEDLLRIAPDHPVFLVQAGSNAETRVDHGAEGYTRTMRELLPEEDAAGSEDPVAQTEAILEESDERTITRDAAPSSRVERRTSDEATPPA